MPAIIPNAFTRGFTQMRPYAWSSILVNPNPPRVGEVAEIIFPLKNPGPGELVVERIEARIAQFGMGVPWEELPPIGPFVLPAHPEAVVEAAARWTPRTAGHRCVRASIFTRDLPDPVIVGRNLDVIRAGKEEGNWRVPFHLGNPERVRVPIELRHDGSPSIAGAVRVGHRLVSLHTPIWLDPGEEVEAELLLRAEPGPALAAEYRVEAFSGTRLIDGIQIAIARPALARWGRPPQRSRHDMYAIHGEQPSAQSDELSSEHELACV
jgi:hypothetical protein